MSNIEEQLMRDIADVTKGVVVTDSDLYEARKSVDERIDTTHQRDRRRAVVAVAAVAAATAVVGFAAFQVLRDSNESVVPAGPAPSDPNADYLTGAAPTPELLNGFWRLDNGTIQVRFDKDGTASFDDRGTLISDPTTTGTYEIVGNDIIVTTTDAPGCIDSSFKIHASFPVPGNMRTVLDDNSLGTCQPAALTGRLQHVLPASGEMGNFKLSFEQGFKPLTNEQHLYGDWLAEGGEQLLEVAPDGTYYVADESNPSELVDTGKWSLSGSDLTFTSSSESPTCQAGDTYVLANAQLVQPDTRGIKGTVQQNTCGAIGTPTGWYLIPDKSID